MQHIRFGLSIDSGAGAHFHAAVGRSALGPLGLLNVLETHLGLLRAPVAQSERVVQMRQCLRSAMTGPPEFDNSSSSTRRHLNGIKGLASFGEFSCNGTSLSVCSSFQ